MPEPKFIPKPGQINYTNIRYAPVVNTIVTCNGQVLLLHRSKEMRLYPDTWSGVSGFLDDHKSIEEKVTEELAEELGIAPEHIIKITRGQVLIQEAPNYNKTWLVVPMHAEIATQELKLDWEHQDARWFTPVEAKKQKFFDGFLPVLEQFV